MLLWFEYQDPDTVLLPGQVISFGKLDISPAGLTVTENYKFRKLTKSLCCNFKRIGTGIKFFKSVRDFLIDGLA